MNDNNQISFLIYLFTVFIVTTDVSTGFMIFHDNRNRILLNITKI